MTPLQSLPDEHDSRSSYDQDTHYPLPRSDGRSPWNLQSVVRYCYLHTEATNLIDFSREGTRDKRMPCLGTLRRWSAQGEWTELKTSTAPPLTLRDALASSLQIEESELALPTPESDKSLYLDSLPRALRMRYLKLIEHESLMNLSSDIALVSLRIQLAMRSLSDAYRDGNFAGTDNQWQDLKRSYELFHACMQAGNNSGANQALQEMSQILQEHADDKQSWDLIEKLIELRGRLIHAETNRAEKAGDFVTIQEAVETAGQRIGALTAAVEEHVRDPRLLSLIRESYNNRIRASEIVQSC